MGLSRQQLSGYDAMLRQQEGAAAEYVRRRLEAWLSQNPSAPVAEAREYAIRCVNDAATAYGDAASTIAADLYDGLARQAGKSLRPAAIDASDVRPYVEEEAHWQSGKLAAGAPAGFVKGMSACATDQVARRANQTMRRNSARDKIRYARVPMGGETCTFCAMLASRGFAFRSRAAAGGEGNHYHHNCRCKVVPETVGSVEGYDPDEWAGIWHAMEEVDADPRMTEAQKREAKARIAERGRPAGIDRAAEVYDGVPSAYVDVVERIVHGAGGGAKALYLKHEGNFLKTGLSGNGSSFYSPTEGRVYFNGLDKVFGGNGKELADTWFHEFGHNIDWLEGGGSSYAESWRGGAFQRSLKSEAMDYAMERKADVSAMAERAIRSHDVEKVKRLWHEWGLVDTKDFLKWWGGSLSDDGLVAKLKKPTIKHAYKLIEGELNSISSDETCAVSDIFDGATRHRIKDGWGHWKQRGKPEYWDKDGRALSHEAFAELFACHLSSPKGLARMREYFPKSSALFEEMLADMVDGGA